MRIEFVIEGDLKRIQSLEDLKRSELETVFESLGIPTKKLIFPDDHIALYGQWHEFFPAIPSEVWENLLNKIEFIFDDETPVKCLSFEYYPLHLIRGVYSMKQDQGWYQLVRYLFDFKEKEVKVEIRVPYKSTATKEELIAVFEQINEEQLFKRMERLFERMIFEITEHNYNSLIKMIEELKKQ